MNARFSPTALASIILAACGLVLFAAGCRSDGPGEKDELAGVTQFVVNGSFEELDGQLPNGWRTRSWQRDGDAAFDVESSGHNGGRSVSISSAKGADASWIATVPIRPYSRYKLSGFIKTERRRSGLGPGRPDQHQRPGGLADRAARRDLGLEPGRRRVRRRRQRRRRSDVPVRRLGQVDGQGLVRRHRAGAALRQGPRHAQGHDRRRQDRKADVQVHLRPVHRALGPLHLPGALGRDARGPQILLAGRGGGIPLEDGRPGRPGQDGQGQTLHGRTHAARDAHGHGPGRDRAGGAGPRRREGIRGAHRPGRGRGCRAGHRQSRLGRRPGRPPDPRGQDDRARLQDLPLHLQGRRVDRERPAGDRLVGPRLVQGRDGLDHAGGSMSKDSGPRSWRSSRSSTRPSIAGRAATSSAATTGATASATATGGRRARTRPGRASSTTTSASTSIWT